MQSEKNLIHRRGALGAPGLLAPAFSVAAGQDAPQELGQSDRVVREIDLTAYPDGLVFREAETELAVPLIRGFRPQEPTGPESASDSFARNAALVVDQEDIPTVPMLPLVEAGEDTALAFNIYLPEADDLTLFGPPQFGQPLTVTPSPSYAKAKKGNTRAGNTTDGTVYKKNDFLLARFELFGIIKKDLNPTCTQANVQGVWGKLDLFGWLLGSINRWKTFAEGTLGSIDGQPGMYQFHWTKPEICGIGKSNYDAIYNGLLTMFKKLVEEVAGKIGRVLDDLLKASQSISAFLANTIVKWISSAAAGSTSQAQSFNLAASSANLSVKRGATVSTDIRIEAINGFGNVVTLSASGLTSSTIRYSPSSSIKGGGQIRMSIQTSKSSPIGTHTITVEARSGSTVKSIPIQLRIAA